MSLARTLLPELEQEFASTRALLERVPAERGDWKPHPKSASMGELAAHLADLVSWMSLTLETLEYDFAAPAGPDPTVPYTSPGETLRRFDAGVARARAAISAATDADLQVVWTLKVAGRKVLALPRTLCLRSFTLNHLIHHRGQLTVYLRLCDVPLPRVYGPTADAP